MHIAGKVFLVLGLLITLARIVMTIGGGSALSDVGEWDVEGKSQFDGPDGYLATYWYRLDDYLC